MLTWIEIDTGAIGRNIEAFRSVVSPGTAVMSIVKGNAYGHGIEVVAPVAARHADWLGVNNLEEALAVRDLGIDKPVAILGHTELDRLDYVISGEFRQVVYREDVAVALARYAEMRGTKARVHLKVETGTHRQGVALDSLEAFVKELRKLSNLEVEGVYTHFANIEDTLDPAFAQFQIEEFRRALAIVQDSGARPSWIHASATSGALLYPEMGFNMIRVGIGTYGIWPSRETQLAARERGRKIALTPAITWKTRIVQIKTIRSGEFVGYGLTYQASHPMKIAILPIGYYDGYDRKLSNSGRVLVGERAVPVIGRVMMNMIAIDVTDADVKVDDEVVLIGRQGKAEIRVEELAEKIGTISYEVVSRIHPGIPRFA
ncbi:MAG TPA: alanine racemase [Terriglobia bacterium]|nr:alanine racemase [Terriglobia bacterium]